MKYDVQPGNIDDPNDRQVAKQESQNNRYTSSENSFTGESIVIVIYVFLMLILLAFLGTRHG